MSKVKKRNKKNPKVLGTIKTPDFFKIYSLSYIYKKDDSAYGKEILDYIKTKVSSDEEDVEISHSSLYPMLKSLVEDEGLLYIEEREANRKYYQLTEKGYEYYKKASKDFIEALRKSSRLFEVLADDIESAKEEGDRNVN